MKRTKSIFALLAMSALSAICAFGQVTDKASAPVQNTNYDAALAKKLGASDGGMRSYVLAFLKTGPNDATVKGEARTRRSRGTSII